MDFRIIREQFAALPTFRLRRWSRRISFVALSCAVLGTSVVAQTTLDFLDPLTDERTRIEQTRDKPADPAPAEKPAKPAKPPAAEPRSTDTSNLLARAREGATARAETAQDNAKGFWGRMRSTLSGVAASMGLPTAGLVGLLCLILAGIALLVGWSLFRKRNRPGFDTNNDDIYAASARTSARRRQPGETKTHRRKAVAPIEDTPVPESTRTAPVETYPEDFDAIFAEESDTPAKPAATKPTADDTSTWRKPNLDRLRDSIKADWKADKDLPETDATSPRRAAAPVSPFTHDDPGARSLSDVSDGWEEWDETVRDDADPWGDTVETAKDQTEGVESAASRRIRALRDSLRAS